MLTNETKAMNDRQWFVDRFQTQLSDLRAANTSLRDEVDERFEKMLTKFAADLKATNKELSELRNAALRAEGRRSAFLSVGGGLLGLIALAIIVGRAIASLP